MNSASPMNDTVRQSSDSIEALLQLEPQRNRRRRFAPWLVLGIVIVAAGVAGLWLADGEQQISYRTVEAGRGDLTITVTATGTLEPVNQVEVGSELSGTIQKVHVDYNDRVSRGQVIAELDTVRLEAQVFQARASLASAEARLEEAVATVTETEMAHRRCERLAERQLCSGEQLDGLFAAYTRAKAARMNADAQVSVAKATLDTNQTDLAKAKIRSPIDGIVLKREIESGQTVAASLQTPVLFVIAEDLSRMSLHVFVDEADIGQVDNGQQAEFSVDAWPNRSFPATVSQVRFAPQEVEDTSVVSYEVVLSVDNSELLLLPGMTATAEIVVKQIDDALIVPNAALRFVPPSDESAEEQQGGTVLSRLFSRPRRSDADRLIVTEIPGGEQPLWALVDGKPVQRTVITGATDGRFTEIIEGDLEPGDMLITGIPESRS